jgi:DNA polymerase-1
VHTSYAQAVAVTGRLASSDPNLQNIPVRTAEGRRIRAAFIAPPGSSIVSADYSQIELRIMAHLSGGRPPARSLRAGRGRAPGDGRGDLRRQPAEVGPDQRRVAKVINFGLIYGMSAFGLARSSTFERGAAQAYIERYFARYPGVLPATWRARARRPGPRAMSKRVFGRRLWLPEIRSPPGRAPPGRRTRGDQRADAGFGGRSDQVGDDRRAGLARRRAACRRAC